MSVKNFFNEEEKNNILKSIAAAEKNTSGEIRVHLDKTCKRNPIQKAAKIFQRLGMQNTKARNAILFYLSIESKDFTVYGDKGIHEKVGNEFWEIITQKAVSKFKEQKYSEGLSDAILECGEQLKKHFPYNENDINELKDEISFS